MEKEKSKRIQTSFLNAVEKKALVWLAERQPRWVTSDMLTVVGFLGAVIIAVGFILSNVNVNFLWLASFGFVVNWYGDSLDGTLARVRNTQRPVYGFYIDHTTDAINEVLMFLGAGMTPFMHFGLAAVILVIYLMLTLNVTMNAHLKGEFRLTYAKLGPTEFRLICILANVLIICIKPLQEFSREIMWFGSTVSLHLLDVVGVVIFIVLVIIYCTTIFQDGRAYAKADPRKKHE